MSETANLALPYLEAAQAQKHVTHNEALRLLDGVVQLAVESRNVDAPPGSPAEGARYLIGASPTGPFSAHAGEIALWQDGAWRFLLPRPGWLVFVADEPALIVRDGSVWKEVGAFVAALANLAGLGVGTAADAINKLAAKLNAALFVAQSAAEGGDGDLRVAFSKEASANTLSHLFQVNYSGRGEFGLAGDEKMRLRVSPDGSTWRDALIADPAADSVSLLTGGVERLRLDSSGEVSVAGVFRPMADNAASLGAAAQRWSVVYAATGTINTSDLREKAPCDLDRRILLAALDTPLAAFQWKEAVKRKGAVRARIHFGPTAQGFRDACRKRGVDPGRLAAYCEDFSPGAEGEAEPQRYGLRLDQFDRLLAHARWLVLRGELDWSPPA